MLVVAGRAYRTHRGDVVMKLEKRERVYGPHAPPDSHPWLATLLTKDGKRIQQWYTRDGYWTAGSAKRVVQSEMDLAEVR